MVVVPLGGIIMLMGGKDMGPPLIIPLEKGSIFVATMGLDDVVTRFGSKW